MNEKKGALVTEESIFYFIFQEAVLALTGVA